MMIVYDYDENEGDDDGDNADNDDTSYDADCCCCRCCACFLVLDRQQPKVQKNDTDSVASSYVVKTFQNPKTTTKPKCHNWNKQHTHHTPSKNHPKNHGQTFVKHHEKTHQADLLKQNPTTFHSGWVGVPYKQSSTDGQFFTNTVFWQ